MSLLAKFGKKPSHLTHCSKTVISPIHLYLIQLKTLLMENSLNLKTSSQYGTGQTPTISEGRTFFY
jgi:hypothetical protein